MGSSSKIKTLCLAGLITLSCVRQETHRAPAEASNRQMLASTAEVIDKTLMIIDPSVVDSPAASSRLDDPTSTGVGPWSFAHLMQSIAGSQDPRQFTETFMQQLATTQTVNGFVTEPTLSAFRSAPENNEALMALSRWCRTQDGQLDLSRSPFRLLAIVNRPDLRQTSEELGELRFIFSLLMTDRACETDASPDVIPAVEGGTGVAVIFELAQPATGCADARALAAQWASLSDLSFDDDYRSALQTLTDRVLNTRDPSRPNASQLNHVRINSGTSPSQWTLRELTLGGRQPVLNAANQLRLVSPAAVPHFATVNDTGALASFIAKNQGAIDNGTLMMQSIPDAFGGVRFGAAESNLLDQWSNQGLRDVTFSFMTCGGCHSHQANGPHVGGGALPFPMLIGREVGRRAQLSAFMISFEGTDGELVMRAKTLAELSASPTCATVDAFTVSGSQAPRDPGPTDALLINSISHAGPSSSRQLRMHRVGDPLTATPISTLDLDAPPPAPLWVLCAPEGGSCAFSGTKTVRYGANGSFATLVLTEGTPCTNAVFGDPLAGTVKSCWFDTNGPPALTENWVECAAENGFCAFSGSRRVRYGAEPHYVIEVATDGTPCTNGVFGDPIWGTAKTCWFEGDVAGSSLITSSLQAPTAVGLYEVRLFDGPTHTATSRPLNVDLNHSYGINSATFVQAGTSLGVFWSAPTGSHSPNDTLAFFQQGSPSPLPTIATGAGSAFDNVSVSGLVTLTVPSKPGTYELRMLRAVSNVLVANATIIVF